MRTKRPPRIVRTTQVRGCFARKPPLCERFGDRESFAQWHSLVVRTISQARSACTTHALQARAGSRLRLCGWLGPLEATSISPACVCLGQKAMTLKGRKGAATSASQSKTGPRFGRNPAYPTVGAPRAKKPRGLQGTCAPGPGLPSRLPGTPPGSRRHRRRP